MIAQLQPSHGQDERVSGDQREAAGIPAGRSARWQPDRGPGGDRQAKKSVQAEVVGRENGDAGNRLAVHQLQLVRGFLQGLRGRVHGGRAEHTAGHGVRHARQRGPDRRPVHGHHAGDRLQPARHVQARFDGIVFGGVPDDRQSGEHIRERQQRCQRQLHQR